MASRIKRVPRWKDRAAAAELLIAILEERLVIEVYRQDDTIFNVHAHGSRTAVVSVDSHAYEIYLNYTEDDLDILGVTEPLRRIFDPDEAANLIEDFLREE